MLQNQIPKDKVQAYALAGKACVILYNTKTSTSVKFWLIAKYKGNDITAWWIYTDADKTEYIGFITKGLGLQLRNPENSMTLKQKAGIPAFEWFWPRLVRKELPDTMCVLHNGYCGRCGRPLTDPNSLITGIGPICENAR